ncbi:hypothetical protein MASR2M48_21890 [Spirochaetota bacterium]
MTAASYPGGQVVRPVYRIAVVDDRNKAKVDARQENWCPEFYDGAPFEHRGCIGNSRLFVKSASKQGFGLVEERIE